MAAPFGAPGRREARPERERRELLSELPAGIQAAVGVSAAEAEGEDADLPAEEVLQILLGYWNQAREARERGLSARDDEWRANWDGYWVRYGDEDKEAWQARERLPELQQAVDRFAASLRESLFSAPQWYSFVDPGDQNATLEAHVRKFVDVLLDRAGREPTAGHVVGFDTVFGDLAKSGALMMACAQVVPDEKGQVKVEPIDAREVYLDPTRRGLYRIRRYEQSWHTLDALAAEDGSPWDREAVARLQRQPGVDEEGNEDKQRSSGSSFDASAGNAVPVKLLEFHCDLVNVDGERVARNQQVVVANEREIVLGPRANPFWHGKDWLICTPFVSVPFSAYGRSFVEGFRRLVDTFVGMTNLVLDGVFVEALKMFQVWAQALEDPSQADSVHPMKVFLASDEVPAGTDFVRAVEMGRMSPAVVTVWQGLQQLLRQASSQNELSLGQLPPKGDITATEIVKVDEGQSQLVRSIGRDVEQRLVSPILELVWATGLQYLDETDAGLRAEIGPETFDMLVERRNEFRSRRLHFRAKGITETIARSARARSMIAVLQTVLQNPMLTTVFLQKYSLARFMESIFADVGLDLTTLEASELEKQQQTLAMAQSRLRESGSGSDGSGQSGAGGVPGTAVEGA